MVQKQPEQLQEDMVQPLHLISGFLQNTSKVSIWLDNDDSRKIEGYIAAFDKQMNLVLKEAEEHDLKTDKRKLLGSIVITGQCITLIQSAANPEPAEPIASA